MTYQNRPQGLTEDEVTASRREHGQNILTPPKKQSLWMLYIEKYRDPIIQALLVAAAISLVLAIVEHQYIETIGIIFAIFLATTVGFIFEMDAARKFDVLTQLNEEQKVKVVREGRVQLIARRDVVVGDTVIIETGDEVPADGILDESNSLQIDESMLTGEPITGKSAGSENQAEGAAEGQPAAPSGAPGNDGAYARNYVMRSTMVMNGRGRFVVTAVGDETEIGRVARTSSEKTAVKTPLSIQLDRLGKIISKFGFILSIGAAVLFLGHDILVNPLWSTIGSPDADYLRMAAIVLKYFMMAVSLIVMAVPEGLPMAVTLSLALNMRRMLKSNNLVRKLHACETMGAVTVICTDKTGTLTQNKMQVAECEIYDDDRDRLYEGIAANTTAHLDNGKGIGNPTEAALLMWMERNGKEYSHLREAATVTRQEPFTTETKQMVTTVRMADGSERSYLKGAPEIVMGQCEMPASERGSIESVLQRYQSKAMRTLALAFKDGDGAYHMQAVFGIADPIRPDVAGAIRQCHDAGIDVKIVTGDVDATACEIGRQIGIGGGTEDDGRQGRWSISGAEFSRLSDDEALGILSDLRVMSRARPSDKQRLVSLLQKCGEVVAVTGDGTNDAPALNHAHVGLSLGSGTNVAKEASDMTLLDDSFRSIVNAVMWGRSLYKNIQRFLFFQLVVNVVALTLVIAGSIVGTEMPLTITQILWVNIIMDTFAALALASLPPSREVMADKPRSQTDFILTRGIIRGIVVTGMLMFAVMFAFLLYCERGVDLGSADTNAVGISTRELTWFFTTFVMLQVWNLFNASAIGSRNSAFRRLYARRGMLSVLCIIIAGQWAIVTFGGEMFRCVPLSASEWLTIIVATSPVVIIGEIYRYIQSRRPGTAI